MPRIVNVKSMRTRNVGDEASFVMDHFAFEHPVYRLHIRDIRKFDWKPDDIVILGSGGMLREHVIRDTIQSLVAARLQGTIGKLIAWGIGMNQGSRKHGRLPRGDLNEMDLVGIRDTDSGYEWVPCVSCMSLAFNINYVARHDYVYYFSQMRDWPLPKNEAPFMCTRHPIDILEALAFLGSGRTIITNSYHGAYWGVLLGRKVVIVDVTSPKFFHMKHAVPVVKAQEVDSVLPHCKTYPSALEECREANRRFNADVLELIRGASEQASTGHLGEPT